MIFSIVILFLLFKLIALNKKHNANIKESRLETMCLTNLYIIELLNSFGFSGLSNVKIMNSVCIDDKKKTLFYVNKITLFYS